MSLVLSLSDSHVVQLLTYHEQWLATAAGLGRQGPWMYALLAALDALLDGDTTAVLRALLRHCARIRQRLVTSCLPYPLDCLPKLRPHRLSAPCHIILILTGRPG